MTDFIKHSTEFLPPDQMLSVLVGDSRWGRLHLNETQLSLNNTKIEELTKKTQTQGLVIPNKEVANLLAKDINFQLEDFVAALKNPDKSSALSGWTPEEKLYALYHLAESQLVRLREAEIQEAFGEIGKQYDIHRYSMPTTEEEEDPKFIIDTLRQMVSAPGSWKGDYRIAGK